MFSTHLLTVALAAPPCSGVDPQPLTVAEVRRELGWIDTGAYLAARKRLVTHGERAFAAYETILNDPKLFPITEARIFEVLSLVDTDRRRFHDRAVKRLAAEYQTTRNSALLLIAEIGTPRDAAPVAVLLSDENYTVARQAATTLAAIGGPQELVAFDAWLRAVGNKDPDRLKHVEKCRDTLKQRLEKQKKARN